MRARRPVLVRDTLGFHAKIGFDLVGVSALRDDMVAWTTSSFVDEWKDFSTTNCLTFL